MAATGHAGDVPASLKRRPDGEFLRLEPCGPLYGRVKAAGFYAVGQLVFTKTMPPTVVTRKPDADLWTTAMKGLCPAKGRPVPPSNRCRMCCLPVYR